jgi:ABC-type polysaccharide/polyol phosphate export permease
MKLKVYSASYRCDSSTIQAIKELSLNALKFKWQIYLTIQKRIKEVYQQDLFGVLWAILMPIIPMTVYMVLAHIKVFNTVKDMPFVFFIAMGMMMWLLMSTIIRHVMMSVKKEKSILTTTDFPVLATMLSQLGEVLHDTTIRFLVIAVIVIWYQLEVSFFGVTMAFLSLIPAIIMSFSLGMILSMLDIIIQDTRRIVDIVLRYGLFVSSVIFVFPTDGVFGIINQFNFFNTYVNATRDLLIYGQLTNSSTFVVTTIVSIVLLLIACKLVYSLEYKIRAYL